MWLVLWVVLAGAVAFVVERRIGRHAPAVFACAVAGFIALLGFTHLARFRSRLSELWLIRKGMSGDEPTEGERFAAIGPITPVGGTRLVSPVTRTPAVAYSYLIAGKWLGVALVPSSIRSGAHSIRLLGFPQLAFPNVRVTGEAAVRHAEEYVRTTEFPKEVNKDDGTVRRDQGPSTKPHSLKRAIFYEQVVKPGDTVCAIGTYSAARGTLSSVRLEKWEPGRMMFSRVFALGGSLMNAAVMLALVAAALTALYAFIPLNAPKPSWFEVRFEDLLDEHVRQPIFRADLLPIPRVEAGTILVPGEARGRIRTSAGEANITRANAKVSEGGLEIFLYEGDNQVAVLNVSRSGELRGLTLMNEAVSPDVTFTCQIGASEVMGRVSWMKREVPAIHAIFRAPLPT
jgi:hypothetical protein